MTIRISVFHGAGDIEDLVTDQWCDVFAFCTFYTNIDTVHVGWRGDSVYVHIVREE